MDAALPANLSAAVPQFLLDDWFKITLYVLEIIFTVVHPLLGQEPIAMGLVISDIALVGGIPKHFSDSVHLPVYFAVSIFAAKSNQLIAYLLVATASGIQRKDFPDYIGLLGIDNICMSVYEIDAKVKELRELRNMEAEVKSAITAIEDSLKAEMLAKNTEVLAGKDYLITWKTIITNRFDSAAFKLTHADLFAQCSRSSTTRRFVIA